MKKILGLVFAILLVAGIVYAKCTGYYCGAISSGSYTATYRSYAYTNGGSEVTELVCDKPSGTVDGDLLIAFTGRESAAEVTPPSGFTQIDEATASGDIQSFYKVAGGSEPSTYTWTWGSTSSGVHVIMIAVQKTGGTWVTPTTANYHNDSTASSTTIVSGAVNTQNGSCLLSGWYNDDFDSVSTPPTGTLIVGSNIGSCRLYGYYENVVTGASSVTRTTIWNGSSKNTASASVVAYAK